MVLGVVRALIADDVVPHHGVPGFEEHADDRLATLIGTDSIGAAIRTGEHTNTSHARHGTATAGPSAHGALARRAPRGISYQLRVNVQTIA
jgi:hypothetical protein